MATESKSAILAPNDNRFVLFPITYQQVWNMYKQHMAVFWTSEEIDLVPDLNDWEKLNNDERHFNWMRKRMMLADNSWDKSAQQYIDLYSSLK